MTFGAIHWVTAAVFTAFGYFVLPWLLGLVMGRGRG